MLATRIVPVLLWNEHGAVKGKQFSKDRCIGSMRDRIRLLERRDIDEIIILDVSATPNNRGPRFDELAELCEDLFCPITVGGGVRNIADFGRLIRGCADKVSINTAAIKTPTLISDAAEKFGRQAVVVSIDVNGRNVSGAVDISPTDYSQQVERFGAGEILLNSVQRDGMMNGYDLDLIRSVSSAVSIPVIACGGCGSYEHMHEAIKAGAHAVASGAMFQFREETPKGAARYLKEHGVHART